MRMSGSGGIAGDSYSGGRTGGMWKLQGATGIGEEKEGTSGSNFW